MNSTARVRLSYLVLAVGCLGVVGCAQAPLKRDPRDPLERVNRVTYAVNDALDRTIARPLARTYRKVTPHVVQSGVSNFMDNLHYPIVIANDLLQAKFKPALSDTGRFIMNTTAGVGGLFDPASAAGLDKNDQDFGLTLGHWGVHPGPYLVIPVLGPSTLRDALGKLADVYFDPTHYVNNTTVQYSLYGVYLIDRRARLLDVEGVLNTVYDRYAVLRSAYLQQRQYAITGASDEELPEDEPPPDAEAK